MTGCYTCGGGMGKHDPVAHGWFEDDAELETCQACDGAGGDAWDGPCTDCLGEGVIPRS